MKVSELITFLQAQPQDLVVVYQCYSENAVLESKGIEVKELCLPRPDGWVANKRDDRATQTYLVFPGN